MKPVSIIIIELEYVYKIVCSQVLMKHETLNNYVIRTLRNTKNHTHTRDFLVK